MSGQASVELVLPARPESLTIVRQVLSGLAEAGGWNATFLTDAKIALSEACSNVVVHAYPDGTDGTLTVVLTLQGNDLVVLVRDHGVGIVPRINDRGAGLGLGLPLIAALTNEVRVRSADDGHTEVTMVFTIPTNGDGR